MGTYEGPCHGRPRRKDELVTPDPKSSPITTQTAPHIVWKVDEAGDLCPFYFDPATKTEKKVTWAPQPGSQEAFLACPVFEVLYSGSRGFGKSDSLLMDFAQDVGKGYGGELKGMIFRKTYPELQDLRDKALKWFSRIWPDSRFHETKHEWQWATGERLMFRHAERLSDYYKYHGMNLTFLGWEELTTWDNDQLYRKMMSLVRSTASGIPLKVRSTTNPSGVGHMWVKRRFGLPYANRIIGDIITDPETKQQRVAITGNLYENKVLLASDPGYVARLAESAPNEPTLRAWLHGDWSVTSGGIFDDLFDKNVHIIPNIRHSDIPSTWKLDRSYDHGQSKPFSVNWWAESDGNPIKLKKTRYTAEGPVEEEVLVGEVAGDLIMFDEWYGCEEGQWNTGLNMLATEIAAGIRSRQIEWGIDRRVKPGPADTSIWDKDSTGRSSVAKEMSRSPYNVKWLQADKGPGSRVQGWQLLRTYLKNAIQSPRKEPGMFACERCEGFRETFPVLPRDEKNPDDVNTKSADHCGDSCRYRTRRRSLNLTQKDF